MCHLAANEAANDARIFPSHVRGPGPHRTISAGTFTCPLLGRAGYAYSSMRDLGGRGGLGSERSPECASGLPPRGSGGGLPAASSLSRFLSAIGSAGYRPELLKRSTSLM